jgi:hypothetical protein
MDRLVAEKKAPWMYRQMPWEIENLIGQLEQ